VTYEEIFGFDVSVHNVERVEIVNGAGDVVHHAAGITLRVLGRRRDRLK